MVSNKIKQDCIRLLENCQFRELCDRYFDDSFHWIIKGTSVLSGEYKDKEDFFKRVIGRLSRVVKDNWEMNILEIHTTENTMIIEMRGQVETLSGSGYNNEYCWILTFKNDRVIKCTAYYDSLLVNKTLAENE